MESARGKIAEGAGIPPAGGRATFVEREAFGVVLTQGAQRETYIK
ncbi:MAG TPA: hypothetical protein VF918_06595 [Anaerolineales bacterium]